MSYEISDKNSCADIGLIAEAESPEQLFNDSALGITAITAEFEGLAENVTVTMELEEDSLDDLYFEWLSELIFLKDAELFLPLRCQIEFNEFHLRAVLYGDRMDRERHNLKRDIKAVTYYNFKLEKKENQWHAEVVFDL